MITTKPPKMNHVLRQPSAGLWSISSGANKPVAMIATLPPEDSTPEAKPRVRIENQAGTRPIMGIKPNSLPSPINAVAPRAVR